MVRALASLAAFSLIVGCATGHAPDPSPSVPREDAAADWQAWARHFVREVQSHWLVPAYALSVSGQVELVIQIWRDGRIRHVTVQKASDVEEYNRSAVDAISSAVLKPFPSSHPDECGQLTITFYFISAPSDEGAHRGRLSNMGGLEPCDSD